MKPIPRKSAWLARLLATMIAFFWIVAPVDSVSAQDSLSPEQVAFFELKIRPILVEHCYSCHSRTTSAPKGNLLLDTKQGLRNGGDSGQAIVLGKPEESLLMRALTHDGLEMPPQKRLPESVLSNFREWITMGAPDPRESVPSDRGSSEKDWEGLRDEREKWWSLQPIRPVRLPQVKRPEWARNGIDLLVLHELEQRELQPSNTASKNDLMRRLSFALLGLPPTPEDLNDWLNDASEEAYPNLVRRMLENPRFGERWSRHWMDVVHYSDTHGYEWDAPAKNGWMYRDYLIRAFNGDVSFQQMTLEQIAGDLIEPRINAIHGINESIHGPMAMRLGERRHGDNAQVADGITQEAIQNVIDTISKGFLATTIACAQCHDHKLDPISQADYYSISGMLMSSRWHVRSVEASDPNLATIERLKEIKREIRSALADRWQKDLSRLKETLLRAPTEEHSGERDKVSKKNAIAKKGPSANAFPGTLEGLWQRLTTNPESTPWIATFGHLRDQCFKESEENRQHNQEHLKRIADFSEDQGADGWRWDGWGMRHGKTRDGDFIVAEEGHSILQTILPAGRWSNLWSSKLAGALRSPLMDQSPPGTFSIEYSAGFHAAQSVIVDHAFHSERMKFLKQPELGWMTMSAGGFDRIYTVVDPTPRRVHFEFVTKSLNNYFPPRTGYGGLKNEDEVEPRSWFGVTKVFQHPPGKGPRDDWQRYLPLFEGDPPETIDRCADRWVDLLANSVARWAQGDCTSDDVKRINESMALKWLSNTREDSPALRDLVDRYREVQSHLQLERTIGSVDDWLEGKNDRIGIRGSYTELGSEAPRAEVGLLRHVAMHRHDEDRASMSINDRFDLMHGEKLQKNSGRLAFACAIANRQNPLTARVYVNRVWKHLFGQGIVRTPDDFGHLGETPSHPALLDYLAWRFMEQGWSTKQLIFDIVTSSTWQQSSFPSPEAKAIDPENRWLHSMSLRRLDAESLRDSLLFVSGRLEPRMYGAPIDPFRTAEDKAKRLICGPLDGDGRRSIYLKMTMMEPPRFLAVFNQPLPKLTVGHRDVTSVPEQALTLLNDPFAIAMARQWGMGVLHESHFSCEERLDAMFQRAFARHPEDKEIEGFKGWISKMAQMRTIEKEEIVDCLEIWQDVAHAMINMKEFLYVE